MLYDPKWEQQTEIKSPVARILIEARKLIENPKHWCGRAPDHAGENCAATAIWNADRRLHGGRITSDGKAAFALLSTKMGVPAVPDYNDTHTHAEVLAMFDRAIAAT